MKNIKNHLSELSIIFLICGAIIEIYSLITNCNSILTITLGTLLSIIGMILLLYTTNRKEVLRGFEEVIEEKKKNDYCYMPKRSSKNSAGYDFFSTENYEIKPNEIVKIWTDVKAYMQPNEFLMLDVRSSMGGKFMLANTIGIIDSDYYSNPDNDGNIGIFLKNISNETLTISRGDKIAQGIFMEYLKIDNDNTNSTRLGGFGSSGR